MTWLRLSTGARIKQPSKGSDYHSADLQCETDNQRDQHFLRHYASAWRGQEVLDERESENGAANRAICADEKCHDGVQRLRLEFFALANFNVAGKLAQFLGVRRLGAFTYQHGQPPISG